MLNSDKEVLITLNAQIYYLEDIFCSHEVWDKKAGLSLRKSELFWDFYFLFVSHFWLYIVLWYNYSKKRMRLTSSKGRLSDWTKWGKPFKGNFGRWRKISQMSSSRGRLSKVRSLAWREVMQFVMQCLILILIYCHFSLKISIYKLSKTEFRNAYVFDSLLQSWKLPRNKQRLTRKLLMIEQGNGTFCKRFDPK